MNQEKTPAIYLVDSENVNDVWIRLVTSMDEEDEILVFYTEKSPHMSYEKVIELTQLSDRPIQWISLPVSIRNRQNLLHRRVFRKKDCPGRRNVLHRSRYLHIRKM